MKFALPSSDNTTTETAEHFLGPDVLVQWELRVAQRADQLAQATTRGRDRDLECWLKAEQEVFSSVSGSVALADSAPRS